MQDDQERGESELSARTETEDDRAVADREVLLNKRRMKQTGSNSSNTRVMVLTLAGGAIFLLLVILGPTGALKLFGLIGSPTDAETSTVDMKVDREKDANSKLDFMVPAPPEEKKEKPVDPNEVWNQRFKELQDKLAAAERNRKPELSSSEIRNMMDEYNASVERKLQEERKAMAAENARLKAQAEEAEAARKRMEEDLKLRAATAKEREKIEKMQRESDSVIVDERSDISEADPASAELAMANDLDENERFLKASASSVVKTSVSKKLYDTSRMVVQGTIISAVLETAIDTQLPGNIRAQVMQPVYSFDGTRVLMPPGTLLIGQFNNSVDLAQKRVLIAWNRAVTPDGKSIAIGSTGTDTLGRAGTLGNVDNRYGTKFGAAMLISAIGAVPTILSGQFDKGSGKDDDSGSGTTVNIGGEVANEAGSNLSGQASGIMEKYLALPPIIRIPQGEEIRVFVNQDLVFK